VKRAANPERDIATSIASASTDAGIPLVLNVPINNAILSWDPAAPPADWAQARDERDRLNAIRTPISVLAFVLYLAALTQPLRATATAPATVRRAA